MSYHGLPYIISNLTMWTITMLKGFRIGPSMTEIIQAWKLALGMKHPAYPDLLLHLSYPNNLCIGNASYV